MADFDQEMKKETDGQAFADWFYTNILKATNIRRIDYDIEPNLQRKG